MIDKLGTKWIEIDLDNLNHNIRVISKKVAPAAVIGVVKADAYGHGAVEVAETMAKCGVKLFAVSCLEEAIELRRSFFDKGILLFGAPPVSQISDIINYEITPTVCTLEFASALNKAAQKRNKKIGVHVEIDTGMGRIGPSFDNAVKFIKSIIKFKNISITGLFSHYATSDEDDSSFASVQTNRFEELLRVLKKDSIKIPLIHFSNSGAVLNLKGAEYSAVRPGLISYGIYPSKLKKGYPALRSVFSLKARVSFVKTVPAGTSIGYGCRYVTKKRTDIITLPVGYADGFQRQFTNRGTVLIKGRRLPVVGSVCMDMIMVDAGLSSGIKVGDEAVFVGSQAKEAITVYDIARDLGTIPYEVICTMGRRLTRVYLRSGKIASIKRMISEF
ncbi:MAG: alanine racemase [Fibrobacteres bacterium]|nr:alanine racemase [Fibrobacterota bacterium]